MRAINYLYSDFDFLRMIDSTLTFSILLSNHEIMSRYMKDLFS